MKIALIGYGRMGKAVEEQAHKRGHEIVLRAGSHWSSDELADAEMAIEFSLPSTALQNVKACMAAGVPVVCGTTGWNTERLALQASIQQQGGSFLYASNFSTGVNLFFALNEMLARWMAQHPEYRPEIEELHHIHKLDRPSGTAITLADGILQQRTDLERWSLDEADKNSLKVRSLREGEIPGTHRVRYQSITDDLQIEHISHGREAFAKGAVLAAEWLLGKTGVYSMRDVLNLENLTP